MLLNIIFQGLQGPPGPVGPKGAMGLGYQGQKGPMVIWLIVVWSSLMLCWVLI